MSAASPHGTRRALFRALLARELRTRAAAQRILVVAAAGLLAGILAASLQPTRPGSPPGLIASLTGSYEQLAAFFIGLLSAARLIASLDQDQRDGWLTQLFPAGTPREEYLALLAAASLVAAWLDWTLALATFAIVHPAADVSAPVARISSSMPGMLLWMPAVIALAALCAVVLNDRARARFVHHALMIGPYLVMSLPLIWPEEGLPPVALVRTLTYAVPTWSPHPSLRYGSWLLLYTAIAFAIVLLLAPRRVARAT